MALSFACPECGKTYRNIDVKMLGRKARCACGFTVRIGANAPEANTDQDVRSKLLPGDVSPNQANPHLDPPGAKKPTEARPTPETQKKNPKKRRGKKVSSKKASSNSANPKQHVPVAKVEVEKDELVVDDHYADLDDILAGRNRSDPPPISRVTPTSRPKTKKRTPIVQPEKSPGPNSTTPSPNVANVSSPVAADADYSDVVNHVSGQPAGHQNQTGSPVSTNIATPQGVEKSNGSAGRGSSGRGSFGSTLGFLAVIMSASLAFWFGLLVVVSRFVAIDIQLLSGFSETFSGINIGRFNDEAISPTIKIGFIAIGWTLWLLAITFVLTSFLQLLNAAIQLFTGKRKLGWADGMMATFSIIFVFAVVIALFLHSTHMASLDRSLREFDNPAAVDGRGSPENVRMIREEYSERSNKFMFTMIACGVIPLAIFSLSMTRLFTSTVSNKLE